jgi:hypothetical protein
MDIGMISQISDRQMKSKNAQPTEMTMKITRKKKNSDSGAKKLISLASGPGCSFSGIVIADLVAGDEIPEIPVELPSVPGSGQDSRPHQNCIFPAPVRFSQTPSRSPGCEIDNRRRTTPYRWSSRAGPSGAVRSPANASSPIVRTIARPLFCDPGRDTGTGAAYSANGVV